MAGILSGIGKAYGAYKTVKSGLDATKKVVQSSGAEGPIKSILGKLKNSPLKYLDVFGLWSGKNMVQRIQDSNFGRSHGLQNNATLGKLSGFSNNMASLGRQAIKAATGIEVPDGKDEKDETEETEQKMNEPVLKKMNEPVLMTGPSVVRSPAEISQRKRDMRHIALRSVNDG